MNFSRVLLLVFACLVALCSVGAAPEPRWKGFKKFEKVGRNIVKGIEKAGPALTVLAQAKALGK